MKTTLSLFTLIIAFVFGSSFTTLDTDIRTWKKLGAKKVSYKLDRDVIHVGAYEGTFTKLKIAVTGGSVNMHKMIVEYGNGTRDNIPLRYNFNKRSDSRIVDLEGGKRVIKKIIFVYDTKNRSRQKATVHVFGKR